MKTRQELFFEPYAKWTVCEWSLHFQHGNSITTHYRTCVGL